MSVDYDHWSRQPEYSLLEAAFLFLEMEPAPEPYKKGDIPQRVFSSMRRIGNEVPCIRDNSRHGVWWLRFYEAEALRQWAEENGLRPRFLFPSEEQIKPADSDLPYKTPEIIAMFAAIREFWTDYDESRPPKQQTIVEWLKTEHELSEHQAKAIDRIIRPEQYRKGGNR